MGLASALKSTWARPLVHLLCLLPFAWLVWSALNGGLGANPVEKLTHETGQWTLRLLLLTLAFSPLRQWTGEGAWIRFRRATGANRAPCCQDCCPKAASPRTIVAGS